MIRPYTKQVALPVLFFLFCVLTLTIQSCKKKRSDLGKQLYAKTQNKIFKDATPEGLDEVFNKVLNEE